MKPRSAGLGRSKRSTKDSRLTSPPMTPWSLEPEQLVFPMIAKGNRAPHYPKRRNAIPAVM